MKILRLFITVMVVVLCLEQAAIGADEGLYGAIALALKNHEAVLIAGETVYRGELEVEKAYTYVKPSLSVTGNYTRFSEEKTSSGFLLQPENSSRIELKLDQPIYSGGKAWSYIRQSKKRLEVRRAGLRQTREEVVIYTARAYYEVLVAAKEVEIQEASLARAEEQIIVAEARLGVGTATRAEVLRAEAEAAGIRAAIARVDSRKRDAETLLQRLIGIDRAYEVVAPGPADELGPVSESVEEFVSLAYENRSEYLRALLDEEIAAEGIVYAEGSYMPTVSLEGIFFHREQSPSTTFLLEDVAYAGLTVEFPIFDSGLRRAELGEARSTLRVAGLQRLALKREIELEVKRAYNDMITAASVMDSFKRQLSFAEENYSMVFKQFGFGFADSLDVIDADTTLVSAERGLMSSTFELELAMIEILNSAGILLDRLGPRISSD